MLWTRLDNVPVMGRLIVIERHKGVASNYDCTICPCPPNFSSVSVDPASVRGIPGDTTQFAATEHDKDCNLVDWPTTVTTSASCSWSSSNTAVATVDNSTQKGLATAVAGGTASITATVSSFTYTYNHTLQECFENAKTLSGSGTCDVLSATITVHFTGAKTAGDNLSFVNFGDCSESLGLTDCSVYNPPAWRWNVEIEADVSDDASQWTASQVASLSGSGTYKSGGQTFTFTDSVPSGPEVIQAIQQTSGTKTIFWIDGPGRSIWVDASNPVNLVDTVTDTFNFTSTACSKKITTFCKSAKWYFKLVVKSGGVLDTTNSKAGSGNL